MSKKISFSLIFATTATVAGHAQRPEGSWVTTAPDGTLQYATDAEGDRIPDFSTAGYRSGLERIPTASVAVTLDPGAGDDSVRIQAAIDAVSALPIGADGLRGAVLLTRGQYEVANTLRIMADGVVLRGEGQYGNGTVITATGTTQRRALEIVGPDTTPFWSRVSGTTTNIADAYVPVGATSFNVDAGHSFAPGDNIVIDRGSTQAWFEDIGVDQLDNPWVVGTKELRFDRTVTAVNGNTITIDAPVVNALEQAEYGDNTVYKYTFPDRVQNVGVENLRFVSETNGSATDENHAWTAVWMDGAEDIWVRQIDAKNFGYAAVDTGKTAKAVTVEDVSYLEPVSQVTGGRRYSFAVKGSETLVQRVFSEDARHDFVLQSSAAGPNVFLFATAKDTNNDIGPHHRWSAGTLFDNVHVTGDKINARWRGNSGTGHGWAGANMVIWNSVAEAFEVQNPPTAQNWIIGATGGPVQIGSFNAGDYNGTLEIGNVDSAGTPVAPNSLYIAQLRERFAALPQDTAVVSVRQEAHLAGDIDNFNFNGSPADNFTVDADFLFGANATSSFPQGTFDSTQKDRMLAFTYEYDLLPGEEIIGATLTMQLRVLDTNAYANDVLRLDNHAARFHLSDTLDVPTDMQAGDDYVLHLDLADFFGPLLSPLQDGQFNVFLSDDHAIDFSILNLEIASLMGDMDIDGKVDLEDVTAFVMALEDPDAYAAQYGVASLVRGDLSGDGVFNLSDVEPFAQLFGVTSLAELQAIPEPSTLGAASLLAAMLWRRSG